LQSTVQPAQPGPATSVEGTRRSHSGKALSLSHACFQGIYRIG